MTQWARCLPEFGWRPMVLSRYYGHTATPELVGWHVHPDVRVEYINPPAPDAAPAPEKPQARAAPGRAGLKTRLKLWLGSSAASGMFVPDPGIGFWRGARPRAMRAVKEFDPHLLVTTGPPHSNHDIGLWLHRQTGVPWVADFRDPYIIDRRFTPRFPFQWMMGAHKRYLGEVYAEAALVTHAIPVAARFWTLKSPSLRRHVRVLTNACAPELARGQVEPDVTAGGRKSIRVIGLIGAEEALHLACAVGDLVAEGLDLELRLIGHEPATLGRIRQVLGDRAVCLKGLRHDLALRQVAGADVLVNYLSTERSQQYLLSSKLFEYLATGSPVIEVNPTVPDRQMLRRIPDVVVLTHPTLEELKEALHRALRIGSLQMSDERREFVRRYEWRSQVKILAGWFDEIVGQPPAPAGEPPVAAPLTRS
jgi:hypothetical protein